MMGRKSKTDRSGIRGIVIDSGYKIPAIVKRILDDGKLPITPYRRPMTKEGFFKKYEYAYDEYFDCHDCPYRSRFYIKR